MAAGFAQMPQRTGDPLEQLFAADRPEGKQIRLHVTLLRVPMQDAAQAVLADKGEAPLFWRTRLGEWQKSGTVTLVRDYRIEDEDLTDWSPQGSQKFRFIGQGAASHFWMEHQESKEEKSPPPDANELLQELSEDDVGDRMSATVSLKHGWQQAHVQMVLRHIPQPETRPTSSWPLPAFSAPRYLFRPWVLNTAAVCPVNEPFMLGMQMEAPHDGQVHTGQVMLAFGRITLPEKSGRELTEEQSEIEPARHLQSWTFAVDRELFRSWFDLRKSSANDADALSAWLKRAAAKESVELLATSAVAIKPGNISELNSSLRWQDARGFEPGGTRTEFRALSCEDETYSLEHRLWVELTEAPATEAELGQDPFANSPTHKNKNPVWEVDFLCSRPSAVTTWKKWKSAMERSEDDPNAVEIAEAEIDERAESLQTRFRVLPGQVVLAGACLKQDRVHATFMRLVLDRATKQQPAVEDAATTTWIIETPASWQNKWLGEAAADLQKLAGELLEAAKSETARIVSFSHQQQQEDTRGHVRATHPKIFFGGAYVNTAPALKGIFFNTRSVGYERIGDTVDSQALKIIRGPGKAVEWAMRSAGAPEWRHWGIWQPHLKDTNARNSGIQQPVFPTSDLKLVSTVKPGAPQVIAMMRQSHLGSLTPSTPATLRWYVARREVPPDQPVPEGHASFADYIEIPQTVQALVVRISPDRVLPEEPNATAKALLEETRQGDLPVLDLITFRKTGNSQHSATTGWDYHFTNGRERRPNEKHDDLFKAPLVMPQGTLYASQVGLLNRVVGSHLEQEGHEWKFVRDARAPEIVTDTFHDARLEWPYPEVDKMPPVTVSVQRPIFTIQEAKGELPKPGEASVTRLSANTVLIIRTLK